MEADLGWSRVEITGAFSMGMGVAALAALPVGRWIDRHGARALMTAGSCLGVALLLVWSRVESLAALYAVWCLMGLALAATLYQPAFAAVVGWVATRGRDRALLTVTLAGALASPIFMPYLADRGYSPALAAVMIGWMGAMQLPARLLFAPIAARFGHRALTAAIFVVQAASLAQLALVGRLGTLAPMVVMLGAANGMATLARATMVAEIFGPRHYGSIAGALALGANGARALAPVGAALLVVALGGYERVFGLLAAALVLAGIGVMATREPARP